MTSASHRRRFLLLPAIVALVGSALAVPAAASGPHGSGGPPSNEDKAVFFAADGLRQDIVAKYAGAGPPAHDGLLPQGRHEGRRRRPADRGAAEYGRRLVQPRHRCVAGRPRLDQQHVPHQRPAVRATGRAAFDPNVLQAESIAQSAERGGLKVAQVEWAGGRNATINGPTIDYMSFHSGRGVATNYTSPADNAAFVASFGLQFDHPAGFAGQAPFAAAAPTDATGWTNVPASYSPAKEMRLRVLDFGVDKYGLNAYLFDSTNDAAVNYDRVLFAPAKDGSAAVGTLAEGKWADVKVKIAGGSLDGKTAGMLVKVERLAPDLSQVRLFHTSVSRAIATWAGWPGDPAYPTATDFAEYLAQRFPTSTAADFAILEAGITSEETYVEQGQYWSTGHLPMLEYVVKTYKPDLLLAGYPTTDEFQHQFLGLVTKTLPGGAANPAYDDVNVDGVKDGRVAKREAFIRGAYDGADRALTLAREPDGQGPDDVRRLRSRLRAPVPGRRRQQGAGRPRPPVQAADVQLPPGHGRDHRQGQGVLGRRHGPGLPQPRRPRSGRRRLHPGRGDRGGGDGRPGQGRVPGPVRSQRLDPRWKPRGLEGHRSRLHQGRGPLHSQRPGLDRGHGAPDPDR